MGFCEKLPVMQYFFILGSHPALSVAEIEALLRNVQHTVSFAAPQALILDIEGDFDALAFMSRLGGTVKVGKILDADVKTETLVDSLMAYLSADAQKNARVTFGISLYSLDPAVAKAHIPGLNIENLGMTVKKRLKENDLSVRWVEAQQGTALSSVAVEKNHMIAEGAEFVLFAGKGKLLLGSSLAVQPFQEFSDVDYGRPSRDTIQGMLPPKLARMMVNLAGLEPEAQILDPFCGSGTILTEAFRLGFTKVSGSDKNPGAIKSTENNIEWLRRKGIIKPDDRAAVIVAADARALSPYFKDASIDAVITEPYLGPPLKGRESRGQIQKTIHELSTLYYEALSSWQRILKPGAVIVMILPLFIMDKEKHGFSAAPFEKLGFKTEEMLSASLQAKIGQIQTKNKGLVYGRGVQHVWREIIRLRRIS